MIEENLNNLKKELPSGVKLVAVSKFHPVENILSAYQAGQRSFAESRPQEFQRKALQLPQDIEWHFIGHLQTNKLKLVLPYTALVQSVDSKHLLDLINVWGRNNGKVINVLLELHLGAEETKGGFTAQEIEAILEGYVSSLGGQNPEVERQYSNIRFRGLMGMATNTDDEAVIEADFQRIEDLFNHLRAKFPQLEDFSELSIGMSDDWPVAVRHGATMVRVGTAIFGKRNYLGL